MAGEFECIHSETAHVSGNGYDALLHHKPETEEKIQKYA